jgi:hypothetical protein
MQRKGYGEKGIEEKKRQGGEEARKQGSKEKAGTLQFVIHNVLYGE